MSAFYNEIETYAAEWIERLAADGHIAHGIVDRRSVRDLTVADLEQYRQCHFFAGIGGWSYALRLAGWPDDRDVWTGSCPCQPFSQAGRHGGFADQRHLWPSWLPLIRQRRPSVVFGEQVASPDGLKWLDAVQTDLETSDYAVAAADLCSAGFGGFHKRQRLYWVAYANDKRRDRVDSPVRGGESRETGIEVMRCSPALRKWPTPADLQEDRSGSPINWLLGRDGKTRPIESGTQPLADRIPETVGRLRAYGNAIDPFVAAAFVRAVIEIL
jgi:DNA (cytosine-5)-methyltransferase 1